MSKESERKWRQARKDRRDRMVDDPEKSAWSEAKLSRDAGMRVDFDMPMEHPEEQVEAQQEPGFFGKLADKARKSFYSLTHTKLGILLTVGVAISVLATGGLTGIAGAGILAAFAVCNVVDNIAAKFGVKDLNSFVGLLKIAATPIAFVADQMMNAVDKDRAVTFTQAIWGEKSKGKDKSDEYKRFEVWHKQELEQSTMPKSIDTSIAPHSKRKDDFFQESEHSRRRISKENESARRRSI